MLVVCCCSEVFLPRVPIADVDLLVVLPFHGTYKVLENHGECDVWLRVESDGFGLFVLSTHQVQASISEVQGNNGIQI